MVQLVDAGALDTNLMRVRIPSWLQLTLNQNKMKKFRFTKDNQSISKAEFERNVPSNWQEQLDENGYFSYGYFSATLMD